MIMTDNSISQMVLSSEQMGDVSAASINMSELMNWPTENLVAQIETDFYELAYLMCRGGWKEISSLNEQKKPWQHVELQVWYRGVLTVVKVAI